MNELTPGLLNAIQQGDPQAAAQLLPLVYDELRRLAAHRLSHEAPGQTLQPTALVHEAYLRLVGNTPDRRWDGRGHFFAAAAEAMRRILVFMEQNAHHEAGGYDRWFIDHLFVMVPAQVFVAQHLATYKEYPPRQKAGSFNLDRVLEKMQEAGSQNR
jgi:hypothetical protein